MSPPRLPARYIEGLSRAAPPSLLPGRHSWARLLPTTAGMNPAQTRGLASSAVFPGSESVKREDVIDSLREFLDELVERSG